MAFEVVYHKKKIKLDLLDKKIYFHVLKNARTPEKSLASLLRISPQRFHYKLKRLKKNILSPAVLINFPLLGINSYFILTSQLLDQTIPKLKNSSEIFGLFQAIGKYQYMVQVITNDIVDFCKKYLSSYYVEIHLIVRYIPDEYNPFLFEQIITKPKEDKKIVLDRKDYKILLALSSSPHDSFLSLSQKTRLDRQTIKSRIKILQDANVIQKFNYGSHIFNLGFLVYMLKIEVIPQVREKTLNEIRSNPFAGFVYETYTGFIMYYMPPSHRELFDLTKQVENIEPTTRIEPIQITEVIKLDPIPRKIIQIFEERAK